MADFQWNMDEHLFLWTMAMPKLAICVDTAQSGDFSKDLGTITMPELGLVMDYAVSQTSDMVPLRPVEMSLRNQIGALCSLNPLVNYFMENAARMVKEDGSLMSKLWEAYFLNSLDDQEFVESINSVRASLDA